MMTTIAITGIGGVIGRRMAERAVERGWEVRGFDIDAEAVDEAKKLGADTAVGDVGDRDFLSSFFEGADLVFYTAAIVDETGPEERFWEINVEGTENVCHTARDAGVDRFVHLSSVMVYGFDYPDRVDETHPLSDQDNIYCHTKQKSELKARDFHDTGRFEVVTIRPGDVYGARSRPWVLRPLEMMEAGLFNLPGGGQGVINHVHVDNVLDAVFLALERDATGEVFNVTDGVGTSCKQFFAHHARWLGKDGVSTLPTPLLKGFLTVSGPVWKLFGCEPPATPEAMDFLLRSARVSSQKAVDELGYEPSYDLESGMDEVAEKLREVGRI